MKNTNTIKRLLTVLLAAAAMSLAACGGGDGGSATTGELPSGKVGTVGDGLNAAEFEAIQCGMNKDQVMAIVGDAPTIIAQEVGWIYSYTATFSDVIFSAPNGVVKSKSTSPAGKPPTVRVTC